MQIDSSELTTGKKIPKDAHTIFSFRLPFAIPIPDGWYRVRIGKHVADVSLKRIQQTQIEGFKQEGGYAQLFYDKYGRSSFSFIEMRFPWTIDLEEIGRKPLLLGDVGGRFKAKETLLRFLNRFIEAVRYVTGEFWIEPVRYQDILSHKVSYWDGKKVHPVGLVMLETGVGGMKMGTGQPFQIEKAKIEELKSTLEKELELDSSKIFLLNSKDACLQEDYRLAVIESVVALETALYRFIRVQGKKLKVSDKDLENWIKDIGLTGNISVSLKFLTNGLEQIDEEVIRKCMGAIKIRNHVLHRGLREVGSTDTEDRVVAIEKMISYLNRLLPDL